MAPEQDELREELAVCYRIFDQLDWVELISNPSPRKYQGPEHHFLGVPGRIACLLTAGRQRHGVLGFSFLFARAPADGGAAMRAGRHCRHV